jgi:hypothetical protein
VGSIEILEEDRRAIVFGLFSRLGAKKEENHISSPPTTIRTSLATTPEDG